MPPATFDTAACAAALGDDADAFSIHAFPECDSTNTQLMLSAECGAPSGSVFVADHQTAGRGRRGRSWISSPQDSLTFSLLWRFAAHSSAPEALPLAVGLGLQRAMASLGVPAKLKWPNDVLCEGRKLAGILIEVQSGDIKSAIIGIGINLRIPQAMPTEVADNAIALEQAVANPIEREGLMALLLKHLAQTLNRYETAGFASLRDEWQAQHAFQNAPVRISGGEEMEGICRGVTERGELILSTPEGIRTVISGDVTLRPT